MQNEDASQAGSMGHSAPIARADVDTLPAGSYGPATGNAITGAGTATGSSGADTAASPATIVNVQGAGGPTSQANGNFQANGQYGVLTMDAQGDFNYVRNPGTPDGVKDVFNYTLADASGANSSTTLTIDIGQIQAAAAGQGIVNLPAGVQLSDIHVNGRDLVINMPDGTQMVIPNGAVFVPELAIGDVQVPPTNLAALLIDSEPQPGAGQNQSSGGNFAEPVPPLDPGVPLGDLIPPTELTYIPPDFRPIGQFEDTEPTVVIEPHDLAPGAVDALDQVSEKGLPARNGDLLNEPAGTGEIADGNGTNDSDGSEHTFGSIVFSAEDGLQSITINNVVVTGASVGTTIVGQFGTMLITGVDLASGTINYTYTLTDNNLLGDVSADHFAVVVTDADGDVAAATLTVDIVDDAPIARNDTDLVAKGSSGTDGNVLTGADTTSGANGADTPGADNLVNNGNGVTGIHAGTSGAFDGVTSGGTLVHGTFGDLVIHSDGSYTYTLNDTNGTPGGNDVFTYQITDQDGDTATATLTIAVPADTIPVADNATALVDDDGLPLGNHDSAPGDDTQSPDPDNNETTVSGTLTANFGGDGPGTFAFASGMNNSTATVGQETVTYHVVGGVLTAEVTDSPDASREGTDLFTVTINADGTYSVQLLENVLQINDHTNTENNASATISFTATDSDGDTSLPATLTISLDDDIPTAIIPPPPPEGGPPPPLVTGLVDEDELSTGNHDSAPGDDPGGASTSGGAGSLDALFNAGADQPLTFSLNADTSGLPSLTSDGHAVTYDVSGNVLTATADGATVFTLTVNADGSWTFDLEGQLDHPTLNGQQGDNTENNLFLDLSSIVVATDSDGDSATGALGAFVINVDDDMPAQAEGSVTAHVDEDELPSGNTDNDAQTTVATGSLASQVHIGADQPGSFSFDSAALAGLPALTSNGAAISYALVGDTLVAFTGNDSGANHVFTVSLGSDGSFTVTLLEQVDHLPNSPANDDNQNLTLDLSNLVQVTDADGDSIHLDARSFLVQIEDDIPTQTGTSVTAHVDEDELPGGNTDNDAQTTVASGSISALASVGADQPGSFSFDPNALGGLPALTSNGAAIHYAVVSGTLVAYTGADPALNHVFTVSLTSGGNYTVTLSEQVDHLPNSPANDDNQTLTLDLSGAVQVTDADGDTVHLDAGSFNVAIEDDIPTQTAATVTAHVDEDELPNGITDGDGQTTVSSGSISALASVGADQPGSFSFDPNALGGLPALTSDGAAIHYAVLGGTLVAYTGADSSLNHVFTISLSAGGNYTVTLLEQVDHLPNSPANDDNQVLTLDLSGVVQVTDADGDSIHLDTGSFKVEIEDDIPIARNDTDEITQGGTTATGNVITGTDTTSGIGGADSSGADAPISVIAISDVSHGTVNTFVNNVLTIQGDHGTLEIHANGDYTYTRTDNVGGVSDTFTYTIQDADGDTTTATLTIGIEDKIPVLATPDVAHLDDDVIPGAGGNTDPTQPGDEAPNTVGQNVVSASLVGTGGDGALTYHFAANANQTALPAGFTIDTANSTATHMVIEQNGTDVITVDLNTTTGAYTVTQIAPIDHPSLDGQTGDDTENNIPNIGVKFFVTDADGDPSNTVTLTINVDDDMPAQTAAVINAHVDEDELTGGNTDADAQTTVASGSISGLASIGADQPGLFSFDANALGGLPALTSNGAAIHYAVVSGTLVAYTGADPALNHVFTVSLTSGGNYTVNLLEQVDHLPNSPANDDNQTLTVDLSGAVAVTDSDGDTIHLDTGSFNVVIEDDIPVQTAATVSAHVDEDELTGGNTDNDAQTTTASGSISGLASVGADQPGSFSFDPTALGGLPALTSDGAAIHYAVLGGTLVGYTGANSATNHVIEVSLTSGGNYTVNLLGPIDHLPNSPANDDNQTLTLDLSSAVKVTDADGDVIHLDAGSFNVVVEDDTPVNFTPVPLTDTTGATASPLDDALVNDGTANVTRFINDSNNNPANGENFIGGDGFGSLFFTGTAANNGTPLLDASDNPLTSHNNPILLSGFGTDTLTAYVESGTTAGFQSGQDTVVFTVTLNTGAGNGSASTYTIDFNDTIDNGGGIAFNDLTSTAAGNVSFRGVGTDDPNTTVDLLLSAGPANGVTVNTDSDSIGAANQSMDSGETVRIDFVTNLTTDTADPDTPPSGFNYGAHVDSNDFIGHIPQVQGSQSETVAFTVYAVDSANTDATAPDRDPTGGFTDGSITTITDVTVIGFGATEQTPVTIDVSGFKGDNTFHAVAYGISVRINADGSATFSGIQQGDQYGFHTDGGTFNAVVVQANAAGTGGSTEDSFDLGVFAIGTVNQGHNIDMNFGVTGQDADGDTSTGTIDVTLTPVPVSQATTLSAQSTQDVAHTSLSTSSLFASNDNVHDQRAFNVGNTAALMGAVAAAGLSATNLSTSNTTLVSHDSGHEAMVMATAPTTNVTSFDNEQASIFLDNHFQQHSVVPGSNPVAQGGGMVHDMVETSHALTAASVGDAHVNTELLQGTSGPAHGATVTSAPMTATAVVMPSAEQLAAAIGHGGGSANPQLSVAGGQHNEVVGKVLADALHGGEGHGGVNIDTLVNAVSHGGAGGNAALEAFASHGSGDVSYMHTAYAATYGGAHASLTLEMAMHQDAPPPAHG